MAGHGFPLEQHPVHLGRGATIVRLPEMDGTMEWYQRYAESHAADGIEGRLVSMHRFAEPWDSWEMHPEGAELVVCVEGTLTLHQEMDEGVVTTVLAPGEAAINPPGVWHTADAEAAVTALFVTAGLGTQHRPR